LAEKLKVNGTKQTDKIQMSIKIPSKIIILSNKTTIAVIIVTG